MTLRKLLVPLTGATPDAGALATAFAVAKDQACHVEGLFVRPDPTETLPFMGEAIAGPVIQDIVTAATQAANTAVEKARTAMSAAAHQAGIVFTQTPPSPGEATCSFVERVGPFANTVGDAAILSDLVIFENSSDDDLSGIPTALEECLMSRGRPILLAPVVPPSSVGSSVTIGWDGGAESAHAVRNALPFLAKAARVQILNVTRGQKTDAVTQPLADYLAIHGVESVEHIVDPQGRAIGEVLIDEARRSSSDLLVIGGYGHSRVRELLIGGATRHVLAKADMPVLMAH